MPGVRKPRPGSIADSDARIALLLPKEVDRQLRALSASTGTSVSKIVRAWIVEKLAEIDHPSGDAGRS
jgi:predicted DNA-binding protein